MADLAFSDSLGPEKAGRFVAAIDALGDHLPMVGSVVGQTWRVVGSAAINYWLRVGGKPGVPVSDLDIATPNLNDLKPVTGSELLLAHRHLPNRTGHYAAVVYGPNGVKFDMFSSHSDEPLPTPVRLGRGVDRIVPVRCAEAQMAVSIGWLARRVSGYGFGSHGKYLVSLRALAEVVDDSQVEELWLKLNPYAKMGAFATYELAASRAHEQGGSPESGLRHKANMLISKCPDCDYGDANYPIASRFKVAATILWRRAHPKV